MTKFRNSASPLPAPGGQLSGEAVEFLKSENHPGIVIRDRGRKLSPSEEGTDVLPESLRGIETFLREATIDELPEDLAAALDLALFRKNQNLHEELVNRFKVLQQVLDRRKQLLNHGTDNDESRRSYLRELLSFDGTGVPTFDAKYVEINRAFVAFEEKRRNLRIELAEFVSRELENLRKLAIPTNSSSKERQEFHQELLEELMQKRTNLSPLSDFLPDRALECLVTPVHNDSDKNFTRILALTKQIIDNLLFRGVFLEKRFDQLLGTLTHLAEEGEEIFTKLTFPKQESDYLFSHIVNVLFLSVFTARDLESHSPDTRSLALAALVFDLGMLRVTPEAWTAEDQPSDEEVDRIKRHPLLTVEWLRETYYEFNEETIKIIKRHHERLDGSGYPLRVEEKELNLEQNILIVVDVYDAMSTTRPHRAAIPPDEIITYLKNRLNKFESTVVESLEENLGPYPPGTVVQLNTNEIGVTIPGSKNPSDPRVKVMIDATGTVYDDPEIVDFDSETDRRIIDTIGNRNTPTAILELMGQ